MFSPCGLETTLCIGCLVKSGALLGQAPSILTRVALVVADRYRDILIAQEGAVGTHLLEYDLCEPPLMFGRGGCLADTVFYGRSGLGLSFAR